MVFFKAMLLLVCVLAVLGAGLESGDSEGGKMKGYVALFGISGTLYVVAWALTTLLGGVGG